MLATRCLDRLRIAQPVAADPHAVGRRGQIGDDEATAFVGHDNPAEMGRQIRGFSNHPDPGLGPSAIHHDAADAHLIHGHTVGRGGTTLLPDQQTDQGEHDDREKNEGRLSHVRLLDEAFLHPCSQTSSPSRLERATRNDKAR